MLLLFLTHSGGWSDTPPLCFEHGGQVTNIAIKIDGQRPIGAKARLINEVKLIFHVGDQTIICTSISDLLDFGTPQAPAALLKCALISIGIIDVYSNLSLEKQLAAACGGGGGASRGYGIELQSWSDLPTGSGLGTSSILAACIIAASARVCGKSMTEDSLVHAVLLTEQLLTTGKKRRRKKKKIFIFLFCNIVLFKLWESFVNRPPYCDTIISCFFLTFISFRWWLARQCGWCVSRCQNM